MVGTEGFGAPFIHSTSAGRTFASDIARAGPADYENEYVVEEIVEPERIVISHPDPGHSFQLFITLAEEAKNKTRLSWRQRFDTREHFERVKSFVVEANEQIWIGLRRS